jgi:Glycosyl hydrolases family 11
MRTKLLPVLVLNLAYGIAGCGSSTDSQGTGGSGGSSDPPGSGGVAAGSGGSSVVSSSSSATGGNNRTGGSSSSSSSSTVATGGSSGGSSAQGGTTTASTSSASGGAGTTPATGGSATGGSNTGGRTPRGGTTGKGGATTNTGGAGGTSTGSTAAGGSTVAIDCSAAMPTSGGTTHCGSNRTGKAGSLSWELWSNSLNGNACITYYSVPAFSAKWNNNGDYLARVGIEWGGKSISSLGEITAEFTYKKAGSGGGYSYIGVYGWARSPCVEYYIIEDSFNGMPFNPWNMQQKGSATIDGEVYKFFSGQSGGTGGSRCGTPFQQYWSVRQKGRQCGVMTISKHYEEWKKVGMSMDSILEAKVLVETGGGSGNVDFPIANVKSSN